MLKLTKGLLYCKDYEEAKNPIIMILSFTKKIFYGFFFFHWNKCTTNSTLNGWWKLWKHWIAQPAKGRKTQFHCKKKPIITIIIFKLHISKVYFGLKHCTPKLLSLQNYINKPRGKKRWYHKKKKINKRGMHFSHRN